MRDQLSAARSQIRHAGGAVARRLARRYGFELARSGPGAAVAPESRSEDTVTVPRGREQPFSAGGYELVPEGRYDIVPRTYYSPVPDLDLLPTDVWNRRSELGGVDLRAEAALELVEGELAPWIAEFDMPIDGPRPPGEFFLRNENYESVDAELLYAIVRSRKPNRVVELGSGFTTLLIGAACRANAEEGTITEHIAYDPFPRAEIVGSRPPAPTRFESTGATEVPLSAFLQLQAGDVLFVDTTHTVKLGSDVNYIVLDVLPFLAPGVLVHFHDIFIPWEYPRAWFETFRYYWAEQYLLQAFLAFNEAFEVLLPAQALAREHPERLGRVIPSFGSQVSPGAMWIVRR